MKAINPQVWGSSGWHILHRISFMFGNKDYGSNAATLNAARNFYLSLKHILPCPKCRRNLEAHITSLPFPDKLSDIPKWVWKIHTRVSMSLVPEYVPPPFKKVKREYTDAKNNTLMYCAQTEATFLYALCETHPGSRSIKSKSDYLDALQTFMNMYVESLPDASSINHTALRSKTHFRNEIKKLTKIVLDVKSGECDI